MSFVESQNETGEEIGSDCQGYRREDADHAPREGLGRQQSREVGISSDADEGDRHCGDGAARERGEKFQAIERLRSRPH